MCAARIEPRTLKGFRDYLPEMMIVREQLIDTARQVFRSYGYTPIDTPALEYLEILSGKGGEETDKQLYRFQDHGGRWVGLRFDLTVPLARFAAQHIGRLGTPLKRYHIATVWRGENTQRGRYREFMQCDFDIIGTRSPAADIETALVIHDLLSALGLSKFSIRLNNRQVLNGFLELLGLADRSAAVLRALDKLAKAGPRQVVAEMVETAGASEEQAKQILSLGEISGDNQQVLAQAAGMLRGNQQGLAGIQQLEQMLVALSAAGIPDERLRVDLSIARGLDYYTGTVYETYLDDLPGIGSVCSGGRYDNLAEMFTDVQLPGVGASLGLDRLLAALEELGKVQKVSATAPVFIAFFASQRLPDYLRLAAALRAAGIGAEVFPEPKKLSQQLKYADRRGFRVALIIGEDEFRSGRCQIKDLQQAVQQDVPLEPDARQIIAAVRQILSGGGP
jgi:histidyl-tRNA synthetase